VKDSLDSVKKEIVNLLTSNNINEQTKQSDEQNDDLNNE
jgi:hypothetical protein